MSKPSNQIKNSSIPNGVDRTDIARSLGYRGETRVRVLNDRVISHQDMPWVRFKTKLRTGRL